MLVLTLAGVLSAQPFPSFPLDTTVVTGPDAGKSYSRQFVAGDSVDLVVWVNTDRSSVQASRVSRSLVPLDTIPLDISGTWPAGTGVSAASGGDGFLVAWLTEGRVMVTLVNHGGRVERHPVDSSTWRGYQETSVAFDGTNFLVAWVECVNQQSYVNYKRVTPQGQVLDPGGRRLVPAAVGQYGVHVAYGADRYAVAYVQDAGSSYEDGVRYTFVLPDGSLPNPAGWTLRPDAALPSIAFDGSRFVITSYDSAALLADRVSAEGTVLDSGTVVWRSGVGDQAVVASRADTTLVVWYQRDSELIRGRRLDGQGRVLDSSCIALSDTADGCCPAAAATAGGFVVAWTRAYDIGFGGELDVVGRRVAADGRVLDSLPALLSLGANDQSECDLASDGEAFLAVWVDRRPEVGLHDRTLRGARFSPGGALDPGSFRVAGPQAYCPALAYGGDVYLAGWIDGATYDVRAVRISRSGVVLDSPPIRLPGSSGYAVGTDAAYLDGVFLVVWESDNRIVGARVTPAGAVLDTAPLLLQIRSNRQEFPQVAAGLETFLITRTMQRSLAALRVSSDARVLDSTEIELGWTYAEGENVAWGRGVFLIVDQQPEMLAAYRLSEQGQVIGEPLPLPPLGWRLGSDRPTTFDGANFLVVSQELGSVRGVRVSPDGQLLDTAAFCITEPADVAGNVAVGTDSHGNVGMALFSYERQRYNASRIRYCCFPVIGGIGSEDAADPRGSVRIVPNPAATEATLAYALHRSGAVRVTLYDVAGRPVRVLVDRPAEAGAHDQRIDLSRVPAGVYLVRTTSSATVTKLVIAR